MVAGMRMNAAMAWPIVIEADLIANAEDLDSSLMLSSITGTPQIRAPFTAIKHLMRIRRVSAGDTTGIRIKWAIVDRSAKAIGIRLPKLSKNKNVIGMATWATSYA